MVTPDPDDKIYPVAKLAMIVKSLIADGVVAKDALVGLGLSESALSSPRTRVSLNQTIEACRTAERLSRDRWFAFHTGLRFHLATYGMYGFAMLSSTNYRQTMDFAVKYHQLAVPLGEVLFTEANHCGIWTFAPTTHPRVDARIYRFLVEMHFGIQTSLLREVMGAEFAFRELRVTYERPDDTTKYADIVESRVVFGQSANQFIFDAAWLDRVPNRGNELTYATVVEMCDKLLEELQLRIGLVGKVRHVLLVNFMRPMGPIRVARELKMSVRTLRRKLHEEKTSFRKLLDELRMNVAIKYLRETNLTIEDISHVLGYSEPANFRRAFHRWTKAAPRRFRDVSRGVELIS